MAIGPTSSSPSSPDTAGSTGLAFLLTAIAGLSTTFGSLIACFMKPDQTHWLSISLAFSAGVMIYISFVEIFAEQAVEAIRQSGMEKGTAYAAATGLLFAGILGTSLLDLLVHYLMHCHCFRHHCGSKQSPMDQQHQVDPTSTDLHRDKSFDECKEQQHGSRNIVTVIELTRSNCDSIHTDPHPSHDVAPQASTSTIMNSNETSAPLPLPPLGEIDADADHLIPVSLMTGLAIAIHNFPEGMITLIGTLADTKLGVVLCCAIIIHNIPEGICVSMPVFYATKSKTKAFLYSVLSGISEPIGAALGYFALRSYFSPLVFGVLFALISGMMIYIAFRELLPTARRYDPQDRYVSMSTFIGMGVMALSLVMLAF